jgi:hypothetical protein
MDAHEVGFTRSADGRQEAGLDFFLVVFDQNGKALHQHADTLRLSLDQKQYDEMLKNGVILNADSEAPAGSVRARVVVHDLSSGAVGSVDVSLK